MRAEYEGSRFCRTVNSSAMFLCWKRTVLWCRRHLGLGLLGERKLNRHQNHLGTWGVACGCIKMSRCPPSSPVPSFRAFSKNPRRRLQLRLYIFEEYNCGRITCAIFFYYGILFAFISCRYIHFGISYIYSASWSTIRNWFQFLEITWLRNGKR